MMKAGLQAAGLTRLASLGRGGCGMVLLVRTMQRVPVRGAWDTRADLFAIKFELKESPRGQELKDERARMKQLEAVPVTSDRGGGRRFIAFARGAAEINGLPVVMTRYYSKGLEKLLMERTPVEGPWLQKLLERILRGVAFLHENGVVHRDLKPQNIMLKATDEPVIIDFGLANCSGRSTGTHGYLAPEQRMR